MLVKDINKQRQAVDDSERLSRNLTEDNKKLNAKVCVSNPRTDIFAVQCLDC